MTARPQVARRSLLALATAVAAAGPAAGPARIRQRPLVLATGLAGAPYGIFGRRLAREINRREPSLSLRVRNTSASVRNLRLLGAGDADLALALGDSAADAFEGAGAFAAPEPVSALARIYLNYTHLVTHAGTEVTSVPDLAGLRVSLGARESGTVTVAQRVLAAAGVGTRISPRYLGLDDSVQALRRREIDAFFASSGVPAGAVRALADDRRITLVPLDGLAEILRRAHGPAYVDVSIPAGTYGQAAEVPTVGVPTYLMARAGLPDEAAYQVTRTMFAARLTLPGPEVPGAYLDERYAIGTGPVPLHTGAVRYYRSVYG
ncbi:TAXI family TRAP transporter solute-binding subunit [Streptomyces sp. NPDC003247]|uniref:TAXI family TRAP transporter solute-binding subunit n=1 Tax=Streptomyces sp. NPDC003247 TaxID=3364677 RepID=UPI0036C103BC